MSSTPVARARRRDKAVSWPLALLTYSLFVPAQFYVDIGSFRLTAYRIVLFLVLPALAGRLLGGKVSFRSYDIAILLLTPWMVLAMSVNHGFEQGLESGGVLGFEATITYLVARSYLTDRASIVAFTRLLTFCFWLASFVLFAEIVSGRRLVYEFTSWMTGHPAVYSDAVRRFGLIRATGPFSHAIHAGVFMIATLAFAWLTTPGYVKRITRTSVLAAGAFVTLSSAAILGGVLQAGLIAYHKICERVKFDREWTLFFLTLAAVLLLLELASNRGAIKFIVAMTSLDPQTGYYRTLIWTYGLENVRDNLIFGIGWSDWDRVSWMTSSSVDAFWLVLAMRFGLPTLFLLGYASIDIFRRVVGIRKTLGNIGKDYALALSIALFALIFVGFTVHYWGTAYVLYFLVLGLGGSFASGAFEAVSPAKNVTKPRRIRVTRSIP